MAGLTLRDRDAIVTKEDTIFRVLGYAHPSGAYFCDIEYASPSVFQSDNPRAPRGEEQEEYYKFYEDEGWKFLREKCPQHLILHEMLGRKVIGVTLNNIGSAIIPSEKLRMLLERKPKDPLVTALQDILQTVTQNSNLTTGDFGVFGSLLHGFHHPRLSDIDLVIYGRKRAAMLGETLQQMYKSKVSKLSNEFQTGGPMKTKHWRFVNMSPKEYIWHQKRKTVYSLFSASKNGRKIKTEFEPVRDWTEIKNEYNASTRIMQKGWVRMSAKVTDDQDAAFMPSVYAIEPLIVTEGSKEAADANRVVSYLEEFRMQARKDEIVCVAGNLEELRYTNCTRYQVALTYCPRYYEQTLKTQSI